MRVLLTTIPIGATTPVHTHRWPSVEYLITATDFVRHDADGNVLLDTRAAVLTPQASDVLWSEPFPPHSLENVGGAELRVIMVEIRQHRSQRNHLTRLQPVLNPLTKECLMAVQEDRYDALDDEALLRHLSDRRKNAGSA